MKLIIICGPTATGKTALALKLAHDLNGELVSADSRQVYKGMDIGTGKDLPKNAKFQNYLYRFRIKPGMTDAGYYEIDGIKLWGLDVIEPTQEFSVAQYVKFTHHLIDDIQSRRKLPILVGGTGFYIKAVVDGIGTLEVPKDEQWRRQSITWTDEKLYEYLNTLDEQKARAMNESDRKNPARLVRAIEVAMWNKEQSIRNKEHTKLDADALFIGLTAPKNILDARIRERVEKRIEQGIQNEIKNLLEKGISWNMQSMNTLGYKEWRGYFEGTLPLESVKMQWIHDEIHYAKRQMTWFKKDPRIQWFDVSTERFEKEVEKLVTSWHT